MTTRAILWCGTLKEDRAVSATDVRESRKERRALQEDPNALNLDLAAQVNGLDLAFRAALHLGARPRDIHACVCRDDLLPREFVTTYHPATVEALQRLTRSFVPDAEEDDSLLFIATNHGEKTGLVTSAMIDELDDDDASRFLTPGALDACLAALPGRQAIIIAACYAGQYLKLGARPGRVVLVSCSADEVYWIRKDDEGACSAFLEHLFAAWCGVALSDSIPRAQLSLDDAFARATERLAAVSSRNIPVRAGTATW